MKSFTFRLEKILNYRTYLRKKAQIELFNARNECLKREEEVMKLIEKKKEISKQFSEKEPRGMSVPVYKIYQSYLKWIGKDLEKAYVRLNQVKEEIISKEMALKQASINNKTLELLKELKQKKYMEYFGKEEQKILDEMVISGKGQNA